MVVKTRIQLEIKDLYKIMGIVDGSYFFFYSHFYDLPILLGLLVI